MANLKDYFVKECVNKHRAFDYDLDGNKIPMLYRRDDLCQWSKETFEKGEDYFYCRPVDPSEPCGELELCEPEYKYHCPFIFTEKEFAEITGEKDAELLNECLTKNLTPEYLDSLAQCVNDKLFGDRQ